MRGLTAERMRTTLTNAESTTTQATAEFAAQGTTGAPKGAAARKVARRRMSPKSTKARRVLPRRRAARARQACLEKTGKSAKKARLGGGFWIE